MTSRPARPAKLIFTESFKTTEGQPLVLRWAKPPKHIAENMAPEAYQAGVYQGLAEGGMTPGWLVGISIGAVNAALIAGNFPGLPIQPTTRRRPLGLTQRRHPEKLLRADDDEDEP